MTYFAVSVKAWDAKKRILQRNVIEMSENGERTQLHVVEIRDCNYSTTGVSAEGYLQ